MVIVSIKPDAFTEMLEILFILIICVSPDVVPKQKNFMVQKNTTLPALVKYIFLYFQFFYFARLLLDRLSIMDILFMDPQFEKTDD